MKRILVPTDFSPQADKALNVAIKMAQKNDFEIFVLHSMEIPLNINSAADSGNLPDSLYFLKLAERKFAELREKPFMEGVVVQETIGRNEIYEDIQAVAEENAIDLIVMGSHGASGFKEMFIGSNTEKVVRTSEIPVLVIKKDVPSAGIKNFVFATDFNEECWPTFKQAQKFAEMIGAKLHLLYVNTPIDFKTTQQAYESMNNFVKGLVPELYSLNIYNDTSVEKGILNFAKYNDMQLIGMSTHGRKGISHLLNGSISEDLVNHANLPVITFKI